MGACSAGSASASTVCFDLCVLTRAVCVTHDHGSWLSVVTSKSLEPSKDLFNDVRRTMKTQVRLDASNGGPSRNPNTRFSIIGIHLIWRKGGEYPVPVHEGEFDIWLRFSSLKFEGNFISVGNIAGGLDVSGSIIKRCKMRFESGQAPRTWTLLGGQVPYKQGKKYLNLISNYCIFEFTGRACNQPVVLGIEGSEAQ